MSEERVNKTSMGFKGGGANLPSMKKRIRDLKRFLDYHGELPEEVKKEKRKEIVELRKKLKNKLNAEKRQGKYKSVKFFERKKLLRKEKQIKALLIDNQDEERLKEKLAQVQDNLFYVDNFPSTMKYISLFPPQETEEISTKREQIRQKIRETMGIKQRIKVKTHREKEDEVEDYERPQIEE